MTHEVKLILDKNLNGALTNALNSLGYDTIQSGGVIPEKTPDMKFIQIAAEQGRTVVTKDQNFDKVDSEVERDALEEIGGELPDHHGIIIVPTDESLVDVTYEDLASAISRIITTYGPRELVQASPVYAQQWIQ